LIIKTDIGGCWVDGEPTYLVLGTRQFEKIASSEIYIPARMKLAVDAYQPDDDHAGVIIHGLGSSEYWGQNRNGDLFPEQWEKQANLINDDPTKMWGYHTFEKNAFPFRNHNNKDPKFALGPKVVCAAWNPKMHRVEVLAKIARAVAPDIADKIDADEPLMWSMGAKVPFDVCTGCGHRAKTAMEYCDCLRFKRGQITPKGIKIGMENPKPNFFDISQVGRGADISAYSLAKVAGLANWSDATCDQKPQFNVPAEKTSVLFSDKIGQRDSTAAIDKEIPMTSGDATPEEAIGPEDIDEETLNPCQEAVANTMHRAPAQATIMIRMRGEGAEKILPMLAQLGIIPTPGEVKAAGWCVKDVPEKLAFTSGQTTQLYDLVALIPQRSLFGPVLGDRLLKQGLYEGPWQDGSDPVYRAVVQCYMKTAADPKALGAWISTINPKAIMAHIDHDRGTVKEAVSSNTAVKLMLVPMILGGIYSHKEAQGEKLSGMERFIATNPLAAGMSLNYLAMKLLGRKK